MKRLLWMLFGISFLINTNNTFAGEVAPSCKIDEVSCEVASEDSGYDVTVTLYASGGTKEQFQDQVREYKEYISDEIDARARAKNAMEIIDTRRKVHASDIFNAVASTCLQIGGVATAKRPQDKQQAALNLFGTVSSIASDFTRKDKRQHKHSREQGMGEMVYFAEYMVQEMRNADIMDEYYESVPYLRSISLIEDSEQRKALIRKLLTSAASATNFAKELIVTFYNYCYDAVSFTANLVQQKIESVLSPVATVESAEQEEDEALSPEEEKRSAILTILEVCKDSNQYTFEDSTREASGLVSLLASLFDVLTMEEGVECDCLSKIIVFMEALCNACAAEEGDFGDLTEKIEDFVHLLYNYDSQEDRLKLGKDILESRSFGTVVVGELKVAFQAYSLKKIADLAKFVFAHWKELRKLAKVSQVSDVVGDVVVNAASTVEDAAGATSGLVDAIGNIGK
jgi:hypothetical protein